MVVAVRDDAVIEWLLEGDPAIRWHVMRDLLDAPPADWERERRRTASEKDAHGGGRARPFPSRRYAESAFVFSESYSACEIAPLSSSCFAFSISPAGPLLAATPLT
jgi:hypothetical protein